MSTNITAYVSRFTVSRSADNNDLEARVTIGNKTRLSAGDFSGVVEIDKVLDFAAGFVSPGDPATAPLVKAQVSSVESTFDATDYSANLEVTAISLFKNFRKQIVWSDVFENQNGNYILSALMGAFMPGYIAFDFSACGAKTFSWLRVDGENIVDAMVQIAEACGCELIWTGNGTIKAVPWPEDYSSYDHDYAWTKVNQVVVGSNLDISAVNTLKCRGAFFRPQRQEGLKRVVIGTLTTTWYNIYTQYEGESQLNYVVTLPFTKGPAISIQYEVIGTGGGETTQALIENTDKAVVKIGRPLLPAGVVQPNGTFTLQATGFLYKDPEYQQVAITVRDETLVNLYGGVKMEGEFENRYVERPGELDSVGHWQIWKNFMSFNTCKARLPHNTTLNPSDVIRVATDDKAYWIVARDVATEFDATDYSLVDTVTGWLVNTEAVDPVTHLPTGAMDDGLAQALQQEIIDNSSNDVIDESGNQLVSVTYL